MRVGDTINTIMCRGCVVRSIWYDEGKGECMVSVMEPAKSSPILPWVVHVYYRSDLRAPM